MLLNTFPNLPSTGAVANVAGREFNINAQMVLEAPKGVPLPSTFMLCPCYIRYTSHSFRKA